MAKKEKNLFKTGFILTLLLFNSAAAIALLFAFLAHFIPPSLSIIFSFCGLIFPYLLFINLGFVIFWIFIRYKFAFISLCITLLNVNNIDRYYQMRAIDKPTPCDNCIRVMSYNAKLFGIYNSNNEHEQLAERDKIFHFLDEEQADIICFQEYFEAKNSHPHFEITDSILSILKIKKRTLRENANFYRTYFPVHRNEHYFGVAVFSKYRIVNSGFVPLPDTITTNSAMFVDVRYKNDTIRVYNLHLESYHIDPNEFLIFDNEGGQRLNDPHLNQKAKKLTQLMSKTYKQRAEQAKVIRTHIDSCRYSVIICGDFNDTPNSYSVYKIGKGFRDSFRTGGQGQGITYYGEQLPNYRIDYIFHDKRYNSYGHTVHTDITVSDHYPISTYISINKR